MVKYTRQKYGNSDIIYVQMSESLTPEREFYDHESSRIADFFLRGISGVQEEIEKAQADIFYDGQLLAVPSVKIDENDAKHYSVTLMGIDGAIFEEILCEKLTLEEQLEFNGVYNFYQAINASGEETEQLA